MSRFPRSSEAFGGSVARLPMQSLRNRQDVQVKGNQSGQHRIDEPRVETSLTRCPEQAYLGRGSAYPLSIKKKDDAGRPHLQLARAKVSRPSGVFAALASCFEWRMRAGSDGL